MKNLRKILHDFPFIFWLIKTNKKKKAANENFDYTVMLILNYKIN